MKNRFLKYTVLAVMLISILGTNLTFAETEDVAREQNLSTSIGMYTVARIGGSFVALGGSLVNWALALNSKVGKAEAGSVLYEGWIISRDLTNLGLVLFLILISLATMLRIEKYGMKQALWKLIAVAVLINFSLVIVAPLIDFAGLLTSFFINQITDNPKQLATDLAAALKVQGVIADEPRTGGLLSSALNLFTGGFTQMVLEFMTNLFFVIFFTGISAITMLALGVLLIARYFHLTIRLMLMPIAWLMWIWPDTQNVWSEWWEGFNKWLWFGPSVSFFMYLAIGITRKANLGAAFGTGSSGVFTANSMDLAQSTGSILQMIMVISLLLGGMMAAEKMGGAGAAITQGAASGFKKYIVGNITGGAKMAGGAAWRQIKERASVAGREIDPATGQIKKESYAQRGANLLAGVPGMQGVAGGVRQFALTSEKSIDEYEKEITDGKWTPEMVERAINAPGATVNRSRYLALMNKSLITKNPKTGKTIFEELNQQVKDEMFGMAKQLGATEKIVKVNVHLAKELGVKSGIDPKEPKTAHLDEKFSAAQKLRYSDGDKISVASLKDESVVAGLDKSVLEKIGKEGSSAQKQAIKDTINSFMSRVTQPGHVSSQAEKNLMTYLSAHDDYINGGQSLY